MERTRPPIPLRGADVEALLDNVADNASLLGECRAREAGWHDFATSNRLTGEPK